MIARLRIVAVAVLLVVSGTAPARAHPNDLAPGPPTTYGEAVQRIREQVRWIEEAREKGDLSDVDLHAAELDHLVGFVPALTMSVPGAFADSAVGRILRAGLRIGAAARAARESVARHERERLAELAPELAADVATLDAWVPKRFVCPMHCEASKTYDRPGRCPMCGMDLQLVTSDRYTVDVTPRTTPIRARVPVTLDFRIKDPTGFEVARLQTVHEKKIHLMIVSYDLAEFDHVHPVEGDDGFSLRHVFRNGGRYVLYHDFTPDSVGMQVVPVELVVQGAERPRTPLVPDDDAPKRIDGCEVSLAHDPLVPGREVAMTFTLARGRKPVTDLEPFLGAMGHLVMISEDRAAYVHSHPREAEASAGPSVTFRMRFERTGLYKAWGQFQRKGRVITVPFVVRVSADGRGGNDPLGAGAIR